MTSPIEFVASVNDMTVEEAKQSLYPVIFEKPHAWLSGSQKVFKRVLELEEVSGSEALRSLRMFNTVEEVKHMSALIPKGDQNLSANATSVPLDNSRVSFVLDTPGVSFSFSPHALFYFAARISAPLSDKSMEMLIEKAKPGSIEHKILSVFSLKRSDSSFDIPLSKQEIAWFSRSPVFEKMVYHYILVSTGVSISKGKRKLIASYLEHMEPESMHELCSILD